MQINAVVFNVFVCNLPSDECVFFVIYIGWSPLSFRRHSSGGEDALHGKPYDPIHDMGTTYLDVIHAVSYTF